MPLKIAVFSKHLQFLEGAELAAAAKSIGADGIDITVRRGGHVEPERVKQDLPGLVGLIRQQGLEVPTITTDIVDAGTPYAEDVLSAMSDLGIGNYRWGGFLWKSETPVAQQLDAFRPRVAGLAALNAKHRVTAIYHTHSGTGLVGAAVWDLREILKSFDPKLVGVNYDVAHATIEGGLSGWVESFRVTGEYLRGIAVKDFIWEKDAAGRWQVAWKPLGEGMVRFPKFFEMVRAAKFAGPLQLHFEYSLGGAEAGKRKDLTMKRGEILTAMKRDVDTLRGFVAGQ